MKKLISTFLFSFLFINNVFTQVNLDVFETFVVSEINEYRKQHGVDTLVVSDSLKEVAKMECDYISNFGKSVSNPYFVKNMEKVFGFRVRRSFNSNLVAHWNTKNFDSFNNIERRMAEGYILQVMDDKMTDSLLKTFKPEESEYTEYIGVESVMVEGVVYLSVVMFMTKYN